MADGTVYVRYLIDDVGAAADFYVTHLGFELVWSAGAAFAEIARGNLHLLLSGAADAGRAATGVRRLSRVATPIAAGADFYWTLRESAP